MPLLIFMHDVIFLTQNEAIGARPPPLAVAVPIALFWVRIVTKLMHKYSERRMFRKPTHDLHGLQSLRVKVRIMKIQWWYRNTGVCYLHYNDSVHHWTPSSSRRPISPHTPSAIVSNFTKGQKPYKYITNWFWFFSVDLTKVIGI